MKSTASAQRLAALVRLAPLQRCSGATRSTRRFSMKRFIGLAATAALVAFARPANAQLPISFAIGAGATVPTGDIKDGVNTGYHAMASLGLHAPLFPIGF